MKLKISIIILSCLLVTANSYSQTTEFTFQGSLRDNSVSANGNYDFVFALFDASSGGNQEGTLAQVKAKRVEAGAVNSRFLSQYAERERVQFREIYVSESGTQRWRRCATELGWARRDRRLRISSISVSAAQT